MRKLIFIPFILIALISKGQAIAITTNGAPIIASNIINTDISLNRDKLYSLGNVWFFDVFKNPKFVVQLQDKDNGIIAGKCATSILDTVKVMSYTNVQELIITYSIKLQFKDGKVKYEVYNFNNASYGDIKAGDATINNIPKMPFVNTKKLAAGYKKTYIKLQQAVNKEADLISNLLINYFTTKQMANNKDW